MNVFEQFNLPEWVNHPDMIVSISKSPQEKAEDAKLRRFKEKYIFIVGVTIICAFFLISVFFIFKNPSNPVAMSSAFGIATGFAGYILKGKT